jgi:glucosylglycerate synthase
MAFYEENPSGITKADMVLAIPTFNEAETVSHTTMQAAKGLAEYFGDLESVIVNCDSHSTDGTKDAFFSTPTEVAKIYVSTSPDRPGKGNNLRNLFEKVREFEARVVVVLEADIRNVAPHWVRNLGEPVVKGSGYVCPLYVRHKYEATLSSSLVYPLMRCLYGRRVRQPNVGDFGFRGDLVDAFLSSPVWTESVQHFGIDIWMTTIALNARVPICQSLIGAPKIHRMKDPYAHLPVLFPQVIGAIFDLMMAYEDFWHQVKWSKPTLLYGTDTHSVEVSVPTEVNVNLLHERFLQGFDRYNDLWQNLYDNTVGPKLQEIRSLGLQHFSFPTQTWARILFDMAKAYAQAEEPKRAVLRDSLLPLYLGKVLSFVKKTERMSIQQAEDYVETECTTFEETKPYLLKVWE